MTSNCISPAEAERIERIEAQAWLDLHAAAPAKTIASLGLRSRALGAAALLAADRSDSLLENRAIGIGVAHPGTDAVIDEIVRHYAHSLQGYAINLSPFAAPVDLSARLAQRGFQTFFHHLKWVRGATPPALPPSLPVRPVTTSDAGQFAELRSDESTPEREARIAWAIACVGRAGWTHLAVWDGSEMIAGAAMFVADSTAWLGHAYTRESHRRRGAQQALLAERIRIATAAGATLLTAETAPDWADLPRESLRNVARAGFRIAYERPSWIRLPG